MDKIKEEDLILTAYRGERKTGTINIAIKSHTFGNELYRVSLMLLDKIMKLARKDSEEELSEEDIKKFFNQMSEDYIEFYRK